MGSTITSSTIAGLSDEEIVRLCDVDLRNKRYARRFERLSDGVIVKFGWSVTEDEAKNQTYAHMLCEATKITVPEAYRYFTWSGHVFIVMIFVRGDTMRNMSWQDYPNLIQDLAEGIYALARKKPADFPGPRNGGMPRGYMFSEDGAVPLNTMDRLNSWLDKRAILASSERKFSFQLTD